MSRCICHPAHRCGRCVAPVCASCAKEITGQVHREPIGRNDALVSVCSSCATETPIADDGPDRDYEPGDRTPTVEDSHRAWAPLGRFQ